MNDTIRGEDVMESIKAYAGLDKVMKDNSIVSLDELSTIEQINFTLKVAKDSKERNIDFSLDEDDIVALKDIAEHLNKK